MVPSSDSSTDDISLPQTLTQRPKNRYNRRHRVSTQAPVAQLDRVLASEAKGHRFKSCRARHLTLQRTAGGALYVPKANQTVSRSDPSTHDQVCISMVPVMYFTALPEIFTLSPAYLQPTSPPRGDTCFADKSFLPSLSAQYGTSCVKAEPVTGSSFIPYLGAKNLVTKS